MPQIEIDDFHEIIEALVVLIDMYNLEIINEEQLRQAFVAVLSLLVGYEF